MSQQQQGFLKLLPRELGLLTDSGTAPELPRDIPTDPIEFYHDIGLLEHPETRKVVKELAPYQYDIWRGGLEHKYRLVIKTQKGGISTSALLEDFQKALTTCRGKEILIIAQSLDKAKDHLYTLRKLLMRSPKYRPFLITKPEGGLLKDEVTKVMQMFIRNPEDENKPTRIIGLGANESSVWSWKEVKHIHMSDVAATDQKDDSGLFGAAFTRLANTNGTMLIETPPRGERGSVWKIWKMSSKGEVDSAFGQFKLYMVSAQEAVKAGLMTQQFLDAEKERLGTLYGQYYECEFLSESNTWYPSELLDKEGDYEIDL